MKLNSLMTSFINLFVLIVESFLGLRFLLKLLGANEDNGFVSWVYSMSDVLLEPFRGIFPTRLFENTFVFEFSTLFAMLMYGIAGMLLLALVDAVTAPVRKK